MTRQHVRRYARQPVCRARDSWRARGTSRRASSWCSAGCAHCGIRQDLRLPTREAASRRSKAGRLRLLQAALVCATSRRSRQDVGIEPGHLSPRPAAPQARFSSRSRCTAGIGRHGQLGSARSSPTSKGVVERHSMTMRWRPCRARSQPAQVGQLARITDRIEVRDEAPERSGQRDGQTADLVRERSGHGGQVRARTRPASSSVLRRRRRCRCRWALARACRGESPRPATRA